MDHIFAFFAPTVISLITAHYAHKYLEINLGTIMLVGTFLLLFIPIGIDELAYRATGESSPLLQSFRATEPAVTSWWAGRPFRVLSCPI